MIHKIAIENRQIREVSPRQFVQGGKMSDTLEIFADAEWLKMDTIVVQIERKGQEPHRSIYGDGDFYVPERFLEDTGPFQIGLLGYVGDEVRITTAMVSASVCPVVVATSVDVGGGTTPEEENPDLWAQLIALCKDTAEQEPIRQANEEKRQTDTAAAIERADAAAKRCEQIVSVQRGTGISTGNGEPSLGGIVGDLYIDAETGNLYEFTSTGGATNG